MLFDIAEIMTYRASTEDTDYFMVSYMIPVSLQWRTIGYEITETCF